VPAPPRLTRRTFTLSALGVGSTYVLAACQDGSVALPGKPHEDADAGLLRVVLAAEQEALALCRLARRRYRALRRVLAQTERFHAEHVHVLRGGVSAPAKTRRPHVPPGTSAALAAVVASERRLVHEHAASAMRARSGEVARLLAGLSAAAAQQAQVLSADDPGRLR
jgi:hypothetical protein